MQKERCRYGCRVAESSMYGREEGRRGRGGREGAVWTGEVETRVGGHAPTFLSSPDTMSGGVYGGGM